MNEDIVTVVFKSDQMTLLWCHSTALCSASWGKGLFVHLCLKYRLMDVSFITTVSCILKPTHVCSIHHILWQWTPLFNYDLCGKFLGFHVLNFLTACFIWSVSCVMKNSGKAFFIHFLLMNFLCYDTVLSLICPPSNMKILKLYFFPPHDREAITYLWSSCHSFYLSFFCYPVILRWDDWSRIQYSKCYVGNGFLWQYYRVFSYCFLFFS